MTMSAGHWSASVRKLAFALSLILLGCSKEPVQPDVNPLGPGRIAGTTYLAGDPERTSQIRVEFFLAGTAKRVSTTFPNDEGRFVSDPLVAGNYDLTASVDIPGYFPARMQNIVVVPGRTTELTQVIDVPDTSRVVFENLTPAPGSRVVERRPQISGEFRSAGSGFKIDTFALYINGQRVTAGLQVDEIEPRRFGRFRYTPIFSLPPRVYDIQVVIHNRAGNRSARTWSFRILQGIVRRVPADYATVSAAVFEANDGDTVLVAPGEHQVVNVLVNKDLTFLGEEGAQNTILRGVPGGRIFNVIGDGRAALFSGLTFTGGAPNPGEYGGALVASPELGSGIINHLVVENCVFTDNQVSGLGHGGAISLSRTDALIRDCIFTANRSYRGGAIDSHNLSVPHIEHCVFIRNTNYDLGGAILIDRTRAEIRHNTFYQNNSGNGVGGAIMADGEVGGGSEVETEGNLFIENIARAGDGGTIYFKDSTLTSGCDGFYNNQGGPVAGLGGSSHQTDLIDIPEGVDPGFCNLPGGDLRLRAGSPFLVDGCERGALPLGCGP